MIALPKQIFYIILCLILSWQSISCLHAVDEVRYPAESFAKLDTFEALNLEDARQALPQEGLQRRVCRLQGLFSGVRAHGSAKCFLLMGDAMGRSMANLMAGGNPALHAEPPR